MTMIPEEMKLIPRKRLTDESTTPLMLINDISRFFGRLAADGALDEGSLSFRRIFFILCKRDGITQVELARAAGLSTPTVSSTLTRMENDGIIQRSPDKRDRRKVYVFITPKGREQEKIIKSQCTDLEKLILKGLSDKQIEDLLASLRKMLVNILEVDA